MNCINHFYETVMELFDILELNSLKTQNKYSPHEKKWAGYSSIFFINYFLILEEKSSYRFRMTQGRIMITGFSF